MQNIKDIGCFHLFCKTLNTKQILKQTLNEQGEMCKEWST